MGQGQFDERLERVIHAARVRLMERLREAYFHGYAEKLLRRHHLADALLEARSGDGLLPLEKAAADLLAFAVDAEAERVGRGKSPFRGPGPRKRTGFGDEDGGVGLPDRVEPEVSVGCSVGEGETADGFVAGRAGRRRPGTAGMTGAQTVVERTR